ncbi:olfactory receptor 6X1-like [Mantella aurantiaca]
MSPPQMVNPENCTAVTEILIVGFKPFHGFRIPLFVLFLVVYLVICSANLLIIYIIWSSARLKAPMFFLIKSMCVYELVSITNMLPVMLHYIIAERPTITVTGCIAQSQVYGTAGDVGCFHYALMSYDRYLAVCHPLRYASIVNNMIYLRAVVVFWIVSMALTGAVCGLLSQLQFCGGNVIYRFFCDSSPFVDLATSDTTLVRLLTALISAFLILVTILFVFVPYVFIIRTILKIPSASGRKKTFSTCSSHLIVFSMQFGLGLGAYALPPEAVTPQATNTFTFVNTLWTPVVNPLIYSFRNKEFQAEWLKKMKKMRKRV